MGNFIDIVGRRFGRLVAIEPAGTDKGGQKMWRCQCDCGTSCIMRSSPLRHGLCTSCGCWQGATHGYARHKKHPLYSVWKRMRQRCRDNNIRDFPYYGGRGITVCERWQDFSTFLADIGERPHHGLTLDRIDNNGHYEPGNVRWATRAEQSRNRRNVKALVA